jgi:hypothetical protein
MNQAGLQARGPASPSVYSGRVILFGLLNKAQKRVCWSPAASREAAAGIQGAAQERQLPLNAVKDWFEKDCPPDQIAGRLPVKYPQQAETRRLHSISFTIPRRG